MEQLDEPYIRIVEQPARSAVRFRYECEGRSAGPIPGVNSSPSCATYPTIQIMNYTGSRAMVVVSCVTVSQPYRQHPHHLVGRVGCHNGICSMIVDNSDHLCTFTHLGIQCAKRNEIASRLKLRKQLQIDPTFGGFEHITKSSRSLDLGAIRLCFQAYVEDPDTRKFTRPLKPVISDPVYDKKLLPKLIITDISTTSCPMSGGKVMLFCNYIDEEDIEVRFFETDISGTVVWESTADLKPPVGEVHKRVGISLLAPAYPYPDSRVPINVCLQLRRPSDQRTSDPLVFTYLPDCSYDNCPLIQFKRIKAIDCPSSAQNNHHQSNNKRVRSKIATSAEPKQNYSTKRVKVMNVLNGSDSEEIEDEAIDEEDEHMPGLSPVTPPSYQSIINNNNNYFFNGGPEYYTQNDQKPDLNNNSISHMQCNITQGLNSSGSQTLTNGNCQPPNDLLLECIKTLDMECLAAMQFSNEAQLNYNTTDWSTTTTGGGGAQAQQGCTSNPVMSQCNDNYTNNGVYNDGFGTFGPTHHTIDAQEKLSFIDL